MHGSGSHVREVASGSLPPSSVLLLAPSLPQPCPRPLPPDRHPLFLPLPLSSHPSACSAALASFPASIPFALLLTARRRVPCPFIAFLTSQLYEAAESEFFLEGLLWVCVMGTLGIWDAGQTLGSTRPVQDTPLWLCGHGQTRTCSGLQLLAP